jgi:hypothetical protein
MFASGPGSHSAFRTSQLPESAANQLKGCRSNQMHRETKPASAVRLFTSQFNSTKCAAADILRALCTAAGRIQLKTETRNCSRDLGSCSRCLRSLEARLQWRSASRRRADATPAISTFRVDRSMKNRTRKRLYDSQPGDAGPWLYELVTELR